MEGGKESDNEMDDPLTPTEPKSPFKPLLTAEVTDVNKIGEKYLFYIKSVLISENKEFYAKREYADFEWLNHCLYMNKHIDGIVVPPLPALPSTTLSNSTSSKPTSPTESEEPAIAPDCKREGQLMEEYIQLLLSHPVLGTDDSLYTFLTQTEAPSKIWSKKGIFNKLYSAVEESRKANHRDMDEYFQQERDWTNKYVQYIKELSINFGKVLASEEKISGAYGHLATSLEMGESFLLQTENNQRANQLLMKFSESLEETKHCCEKDYANDMNLAWHLDLASRYADALKEMHYRRTCLLVAYEEANRALAKTKPNRIAAAQEVAIAAEKKFSECSELATTEIKLFHRQRAERFRLALTSYAQAKLDTAKETENFLTKSIAAFKQLPV